jgi:hypothetical protein
MLKIKIISILLIGFIMSCDVIEDPIKENENTCGDENGPLPIRKILVEEYTGHQCPNCPPAAVKLQELIDMYCDYLVPIAVHTGFFAATNDDFPADYNTLTGDELDDFYSVSNQGFPKGIINRTIFDGEADAILSFNDWATYIHLLSIQTPEFYITIENSYNESSDEITVDLTVETFVQFSYDLNIGLYVYEDSIVSPQNDGSATIEDYVHMHVLRKGVTETFGEPIASSGNNGDIFEKSYTIAVEDAWVLNNIGFVAFVSKDSGKEIIQAESEHLHLE